LCFRDQTQVIEEFADFPLWFESPDLRDSTRLPDWLIHFTQRILIHAIFILSIFRIYHPDFGHKLYSLAFWGQRFHIAIKNVNSTYPCTAKNLP